MRYKPISVVWELTFACNMRCKHCGSKCNVASSDELTEEEALFLCDEMGKLGVERVTLSGGEPLLRKDWDKIAKRLSENGIIPNMISNGWLIDKDVLQRAKDAGISNIAVSLDGYGETHDYIRCKGAFDKAVNALKLMKDEGLISSVVTSIHKLNLSELPQLRDLLVELGVHNWQL